MDSDNDNNGAKRKREDYEDNKDNELNIDDKSSIDNNNNNNNGRNNTTTTTTTNGAATTTNTNTNNNTNTANNNNISSMPSPQSKPRLNINKEAKIDKIVSTSKKGERWKTHKMTEDYVNLVGDLMYPKTLFGPQGYDIEENRNSIERITSLGYLISPIRKLTVIEKWSPIEIAIFEGSITLYGKNFNQIQKYVKTKTVEEVIEFYYDWKKTSHYKQWKKSYVPDPRDQIPIVEKDEIKEKERTSRNSQGRTSSEL